MTYLTTEMQLPLRVLPWRGSTGPGGHGGTRAGDPGTRAPPARRPGIAGPVSRAKGGSLACRPGVVHRVPPCHSIAFRRLRVGGRAHWGRITGARHCAPPAGQQPGGYAPTRGEPRGSDHGDGRLAAGNRPPPQQNALWRGSPQRAGYATAPGRCVLPVRGGRMGGNIAVSPILQGSLRAFLSNNNGPAPFGVKTRFAATGSPPHDFLFRALGSRHEDRAFPHALTRRWWRTPLTKAPRPAPTRTSPAKAGGRTRTADWWGCPGTTGVRPGCRPGQVGRHPRRRRAPAPGGGPPHPAG